MECCQANPNQLLTAESPLHKCAINPQLNYVFMRDIKWCLGTTQEIIISLCVHRSLLTQTARPTVCDVSCPIKACRVAEGPGSARQLARRVEQRPSLYLRRLLSLS